MIDLNVSRHPSGNLTLTRKNEGDRLPHDCDGPLRGNPDAATFYRAVAQQLNELHREGHDFNYTDTAVD